MQLHFWREMVCYKLNKNLKKLKKNFDHIVDMKIQTENKHKKRHTKNFEFKMC